MRRLPLHTKILIGLVAGVAFGLATIFTGLPNELTIHYIKPFGTIFVNALKMIAVPLILASLIVGVSNIGDISKLSRMGGKTVAIYVITTALATTTGLAIVNVLKPGKILSAETRTELLDLYAGDVSETTLSAGELRQRGPLQPLVDMIPENVFKAATQNGRMLQVVFFAILVGIALLQIPKDKAEPVIRFFDGLNALILKIIDYIMLIAPLGVFALIATLIVDLAGDNPDKVLEILGALAYYGFAVILGLLMMIFVLYPLIFKLFTKVRYFDFFKKIRPIQLLAFSTSSSAAALPVTMEVVERDLGVPPEVSSFVLPLGATINMDGTSLYQSVAAVFIAQALGLGLSISAQIMIVLTATLASIGSAGVPGAGMVMLVIVLEAIGVPAAGLALIVAPDRILDMLRTTVNVTGDATVSMVIASTEGEEITSD